MSLAVYDHLEVQELVGEHIVGQDEGLLAVLSHAHEHRRPHHSVKARVVFTNEVDELRLRLLPIRAPAVGVTRKLGPLHGGRDVTYGRVEPYIEALVLEARFRNRHTPLYVARDG